MSNKRTFAETIALIREGKMAIENNGTVEQLNQVLRIVTPEDEVHCAGIVEFYRVKDGAWYAASNFAEEIDMSIPVTDLLAMQEKEESDLKEAVSQLGKKNIGAILAKEPAAPCEAVGEEKQVFIPSEELVVAFAKWYSGMDESKVRAAYKRYKEEVLTANNNKP